MRPKYFLRKHSLLSVKKMSNFIQLILEGAEEKSNLIFSDLNPEITVMSFQIPNDKIELNNQLIKAVMWSEGCYSIIKHHEDTDPCEIMMYTIFTDNPINDNDFESLPNLKSLTIHDPVQQIPVVNSNVIISLMYEI